MPDRETVDKVKKMAREGKSASAQAGEFVHNEIERIRHGETGAQNTKQAIAIGLSEARRAGVNLPAPKKGKYSDAVREKAQHDLKKGQDEPNAPVSETRSEAISDALKKEGSSAASPQALSKHAKESARRRTPEERSASAKKAAANRSPQDRSESAKKAAETRKRAGK